MSCVLAAIGLGKEEGRKEAWKVLVRYQDENSVDPAFGIMEFLPCLSHPLLSVGESSSSSHRTSSRIKEKERETEREIEKDSRPPFDQTSILFASHQNASIIYRASKHLMKNLSSFSFHVNSVLQSLRVYLRMFNSSTFIIPIDSAIGTQQRNGFAL